jgi:hypothetical protein
VAWTKEEAAAMAAKAKAAKEAKAAEAKGGEDKGDKPEGGAGATAIGAVIVILGTIGVLVALAIRKLKGPGGAAPAGELEAGEPDAFGDPEAVPNAA